MRKVEFGSYENKSTCFTQQWMTVGAVRFNLQAFTVETDEKQHVDYGSHPLPGGNVSQPVMVLQHVWQVEDWTARVAQGDVEVSKSFAADDREGAATWLTEMALEASGMRRLVWHWVTLRKTGSDEKANP